MILIPLQDFVSIIDSGLVISQFHFNSLVTKLLTGPVFMYSTGNMQFLCVTDVDMVKEINLCTSLSLGKPSFLSKYFGPLLGEGILTSSGPLWAQHRKIIAPELYLDKVKVDCIFFNFVKNCNKSLSVLIN